jgi:hypothetical protein
LILPRPHVIHSELQFTYAPNLGTFYVKNLHKIYYGTRIFHFRRLTNLYHYRLLAAWATIFKGESIPPGREAPPNIAAWPLAKVFQVLVNFCNHINLYPENTPVRGALFSLAEIDLIWYAKGLTMEMDEGVSLAMDYYREELQIILLNFEHIARRAATRALWIDNGLWNKGATGQNARRTRRRKWKMRVP